MSAPREAPDQDATAGAVRPAGHALGWGTFEALPTDRTLVMGILNVTPDSFSDGGRHATERAAVAHGIRLAEQGADIVDVGGESTRPHSQRVDPAQEQRRVLSVIRELTARGVVVSVDTFHASTAERAVAAGAQLVNDVSGTNVSPEMVEFAGSSGVPYVLMHSRGTPETMTSLTDYEDTVGDVLRELREVRERLRSAGVRPERLIIDPGLGFAKAGGQDWELLRALPRFQELGHRVLVAASRKRFLGALLATDGAPRPVTERDTATAAISALSAFGGAWAVRVHDVAATVDAVATAHAWLGVEPPVLRPRTVGS
ncbi:dihydropteroate synthase [Kocuria tytonis]|uniref:Dihydropteroate synthase n=1 Tax=Kocuria tytonis TaxID=2054280 RepID=A0A495A2K9_9MICC|nr:dihydropteroate synthase [Kocuria tytonis]RKQ33670.1 dihydropteroate synthase [Kocuria tytonis]